METQDAAAEKAALREEFPGWSFIHTDRDRWWATRNPERTSQARRLADFRKSAVDADTPEELRALLKDAD